MKELKKYIDKIENEKIKEMVKLALNELPEYFWKAPASSTGKYHPKFSLGEGGLVRHTKFALDIAIELFNISEYSSLDKDCIISAIILHDGLKHGLTESKYTKKDHADIMAKWLDEFWSNFEGKSKIIGCVESHMGQWSVNRKPENRIEKFVHICDYLASRKFMDDYYG